LPDSSVALGAVAGHEVAVVVLFTVTVTLAEPVLPLASVAVAAIVCRPPDSWVVSMLVL